MMRAGQHAVGWAGAVLLAALALAAVLSMVGLRAQAADDVMTTTLQPGFNLVGWMAETAPVEELFETLPAAEAVYAWDAEAGKWLMASPSVPTALNSLAELSPGMGLRVRIGGDEAVDWTRSATPAGGIVRLSAGFNLVGWLGPDDSPLSYLALGIGTSFRAAYSWDAASGAYLQHDGESSAGDDAFPPANRGDGIWIEVDRGVNWLQPTGVWPQIEYPTGEPQLGVVSKIEEALADTLEFFGARYGIQAEPGQMTIYVAKNVDALLEALEITDYDARQRFERLWDRSGGWAQWRGDRAYFVLKQEHWGAFAPVQTTIWAKCNVLFHEYFHVVQYQLRRYYRSSPDWLVEGTAERMETLVGQLSGCGHYNGVYNREYAKLGSHSPPLRRLENDWPNTGTWEYSLGFLAADRLAERAGDAAIVEYWRLLASARGGEDEAAQPAWHDAFGRAFGLTPDEFYAEFHEWRGDRANEDGG